MYVCFFLYLCKYIYIYIWLCLFFTGPDFSKGEMFELGESYPWIIPRIMPPNHTPESYPRKSRVWTFLLGLFWIAVASAVLMDLTSKLTSVGQIQWSWATFIYLYDMSCRSSPRARSLIPKLAFSGWLAGWLFLGGWLAGWLAEVSGGWRQTKNPSKRNLRSIAGLKVHQKNMADINQRCAFRSSNSSYSIYSGPAQGRVAGRAIAA